jgi:hypothetical protein
MGCGLLGFGFLDSLGIGILERLSGVGADLAEEGARGFILL